MLLSAMSLLVVAQSSSEIPEGLMNNPVYIYIYIYIYLCSVCRDVAGLPPNLVRTNFTGKGSYTV